MIDYKRPEAYYEADYSLNIEVDPVYHNDEEYLNPGGAANKGLC